MNQNLIKKHQSFFLPETTRNHQNHDTNTTLKVYNNKNILSEKKTINISENTKTLLYTFTENINTVQLVRLVKITVEKCGQKKRDNKRYLLSQGGNVGEILTTSANWT